MNAIATALPWPWILSVLAYGVFVRYLARPFFTRRWPLFSERACAPYVILLIAVLVSNAGLGLINAPPWLLEGLAVAAYYLLATACVVEIVSVR